MSTKSSLSSRHSHLLNTIGSIGRFELAEGEQQSAACATVGANGQPVGLSATSTRRPCNRVAAPRRRRATSERLAVGTLPAVRGLRSDTCGVRRAMHAHHLHRGHTPQSWRLLPSLPSFPWSFCTSLGEPREHSSAIALTPLPSLSCLPLALLCARTTLFARVSLYRADSHDFRLVLPPRALLAWHTCFSFGDPVERRSRAASTLLPGLSRLPLTFAWTRATLSAHFPFYFANSFLLASLCRPQRCLRTATQARRAVPAAGRCMAATTARLASRERVASCCADQASCGCGGGGSTVTGSVRRQNVCKSWKTARRERQRLRSGRAAATRRVSALVLSAEL